MVLRYIFIKLDYPGYPNEKSARDRHLFLAGWLEAGTIIVVYPFAN